MRFDGLDLNLLVALDALLVEQNVSVAATKVHLSQSAMSGALSRLRDYFGDELLVPAGRRMVLTPRADQLARPVRAALLQIRNTITIQPAFDPRISDRRFTIMASDYATVVAVAEGLRSIHAQAPGMTFDLRAIDGSAAEQIERGDADLLITLEPYVAPDHPRAPFFDDDYVVVAWSGNTRLGDTLSEDDYFSLGHVTVELGPRATVLDSWYLSSGKRSRRVAVSAPSFTLVPHLLVGTDWISTMHRRLARLLALTMPLKIYPSPFNMPHLHQVVQWHRLRDSDPATLWVRDQLRQALDPSEGAAA